MSLTDTVDVAALQKKIAELISENKSLKNQKKFGLVWEDKPDAQVLRVRNEAPMLCEDPSKAVVGDTMAANHILINGDNFHALTALRATHMGKVDVIYIDPPYNTGNKDFIYNDSFLDKEDGYRHSKWLSFIEKRLVLAKELLSETGVIFVSIDDNEQARLKLLMDEVFGPENFISNMIWKSKSGGANDSAQIATDHEYIICYAKNSRLVKLLPDKGSTPTSQYNLTNPDGRRYALRRLDQQTLGYIASLDFPILDLDGNEYLPEQKTNVKKARWRWSRSTVDERFHELVFKNGKVYTKFYEKTEGYTPRSLLVDERFGRSRSGSSDLKAILDNFSYPKSVKLMKHILGISAGKNALVLDFFAGSGTTAHAVAELNKDDGGNRQCILITDGGKTEVTGESAKNAKGDTINIAEEITYERVRRVLTGKNWADEKEHEALGGNLRYFKVVMEQSPHGATERDQRLTLEKYTIEHAKIAENAFDLVVSNDVFDDETLTAVSYKVFTPGADNYLVGVNSHDYVLSELEEWFIGLPLEAKVIMVGNGVEEIGWVKNNSDRIQVDDVLGRVIRSRKYVSSKLPLG